MNNKEIDFVNGKWYFTCAACNHKEYGFKFEIDAKLGLRLHKIGCKKS